MGNTESSPRSSMHGGGHRRNDGEGHHSVDDSSSILPPFPGSALVDAALACGNIEDASSFDDSNIRNRNRSSAKSIAAQLLSRAELCVMSPTNSDVVDSENKNNINRFGDGESLSEDDANNFFDDEYEEFGRSNNNNSNNSKKNKKNKNKNKNNSVDQSSKMKNNTSKVHPDNNSQNTSSTTTSNTTTTSTSTAGGLLAKALASEVNKNTNPNTMTPAAMVEREKGLLKAQKKARQHHLNSKNNNNNDNSNNKNGRPVGSPGEGVGQPSVLGSIAHALTGNYNDPLTGLPISEQGGRDSSKVLPPNSLSEHRAAQVELGQRASGRRSGRNSPSSLAGGPSSTGKHTVTIGLSLSRRSSALGHPDTVTRQTAFDFNELQDREYKYVSSTDSSGWKAGGGERGGAGRSTTDGGANGGDNFFGGDGDDNEYVTKTDHNGNTSAKNSNNDSINTNPSTPNGQDNHKVAAPDTVHIPIIQIDCETPQAVDAIISALARGEIFIPHMAIIPEALSVNGVSPPDLVVRFGTERNDDLPPDEWPNWCLEFMHNQLYEYFLGMGARWTKRPFSITLAKKVRWKTVKHMNRYFAHAERVIDAWREKGPQYLDPQLAYIEGGATPEEVARPHGIYLLRNGVPTNYFAPNFDPPYTTKMTRSLLSNVLGKSWDKKRREWTSTPIQKLITPSMLVTAMCGCADNPASSGFMASEATFTSGPPDRSTMVPDDAAIHSLTPRNHKSPSPQKQQQKKKKKERKTAPADLLDTTMMSGVSNVQLTPLSKNEMYRLRTEKAAIMNQQQQQQQVLLDNNGDEVRKPQEPSFSTTDSTPFVPGKNTNMMVNNGNDRLEGRLELSISSSSASFFDNSDGGIPSPPHAEFTAHQETEDVAAAASKKKESERKHTNPLRPLGVGVTQEKEQRETQQPEEQEETNDENSGDSKNHHDHDFEQGGIGQKLQKIKNVMTGKKNKKKDTAAAAAAVATMASEDEDDEDWLNDLVSKATEFKRI